MPNWCLNTLQITGSAEQIKEIEQKLEATNGEDFFDIFIKNAKDAGKEEEWYSYNLEHYGCKWNCTASMWDVDSGDGTTISISFDSPWAPPIALLERIEQTPGLSVFAQYYEPGMGFCGQYSEGNDDYYDYSGMSADEVEESIPAELDEAFSITEQMREWEEENAEDGEE